MAYKGKINIDNTNTSPLIFRAWYRHFQQNVARLN